VALEYLWNVSDHSTEFHEDLNSRFFSSLVNRHTDRHTRKHSLLVGSKDYRCVHVWGGYFVKKIKSSVRLLLLLQLLLLLLLPIQQQE